MLVDLLITPGRALERIAVGPRASRVGLSVVLVQGLGWAALLAWLAARGEQPSGPLMVPIARADYYTFEAIVVLPTRLAMALGFASVTLGLGRWLGGRGRFAASFGTGAMALAVPSIALWLIPDAIVYGALGFDALAAAMRVYVPLATVWTAVLAFVAVRVTHGLGAGRALAVAFAGLVVQAMIGAPILR